MCVWGGGNVESWAQNIGHLWRTTGDICGPGDASYDRMIENFYGNAKYPGLSGPGHWYTVVCLSMRILLSNMCQTNRQDPDMMVVGMDGLTETEWKTHFVLWCMSAAPLWIGIDLSAIKENVLGILNNSEVIAVDQDILGLAAVKIDQSSSLYNNLGEIYWKILQPEENESSANAVVLFNPTNATLSNIGFGFEEIGLLGGCNVRDLWKHQHIGRMNKFTTEIESHGVVLLRISQ